MPIKGISRLRQHLKTLEKEVQEEVRFVTVDAVNEIADKARRNVATVNHKPGGMMYEQSVDIGKHINAVMDSDRLAGRVEVNAGEMGAYIEFGTGVSAAIVVPTLPRDWQEIAKTFYKNGKGTIVAHPYLYPAFAQVEPEYLKRLREALRKAIK